MQLTAAQYFLALPPPQHHMSRSAIKGFFLLYLAVACILIPVFLSMFQQWALLKPAAATFLVEGIKSVFSVQVSVIWSWSCGFFIYWVCIYVYHRTLLVRSVFMPLDPSTTEIPMVQYWCTTSQMRTHFRRWKFSRLRLL